MLIIYNTMPSAKLAKKKQLSDQTKEALLTFSQIKHRDKHVKPLKQIKEEYNQKEINQIHRRKKHQTEYNSIIAWQCMSNIQMDIMVFDKLKGVYGDRNDYRYLLNVIDVYSRYAWSWALTNKYMKSYCNRLETLFEQYGIPQNINCDNEFDAGLFKQMCEKRGIKIWFSKPDDVYHNPIVERFNQSLGNMLTKLSDQGVYDWWNYVDTCLELYNNSYHSTIKCTPNQVMNEGYTPLNIHKKIELKYAVGDKVRTLIYKQKAFSKGYTARWSRSVYTIKALEGNHYVLDGLKREYKEQELMKIEGNVKPLELTKEQEQKGEKMRQARKSSRALKKEHLETTLNDNIYRV